MRNPFSILLRFVGLIAFFPSSSLIAQQTQPEQVSLCELATHAKLYDGKTIRVRGALNAEFEDFTLAMGKDCDTQQQIWLAFGGDVPGLVPSMVNDMARKAGTDIEVDGVRYGIKKDDNFRRLYALIASRNGNKPAYRATATLRGAFIAGKESKSQDGKSDFLGYGHLGCCSLFVITEVSEVESVPPANLDVRGTLSGPDGKPAEGFVVYNDVVGGSPPQRQQTTTNKEGKFEFSNSGPLLLFQNPRFRPVALVVKPGGRPVSVKLVDAKQSDWIVPACEQTVKSERRIGFSTQFVVPPTLEWESVNDKGEQSDSDIVTYLIYPRGKAATDAELFISLLGGESNNPDPFLDAQSSGQRWIKDDLGKVVGIDSHARLKDGQQWRKADFFEHASILYTRPSGKHALVMDKVFESACMANR